jgi:hypothetical protein
VIIEQMQIQLLHALVDARSTTIVGPLRLHVEPHYAQSKPLSRLWRLLSRLGMRRLRPAAAKLVGVQARLEVRAA